MSDNPALDIIVFDEYSMKHCAVGRATGEVGSITSDDQEVGVITFEGSPLVGIRKSFAVSADTYDLHFQTLLLHVVVQVDAFAIKLAWINSILVVWMHCQHLSNFCLSFSCSSVHPL